MIQTFSDLFLVLSLNMIIYGTAIWIALRCFEKLCDILLKYQLYESKRKEVKA